MPNTDFQNGVILATVAGGTEIGITPTGNIDITENGEYDVTDKATAIVNINTGNIGYQVTFKVDGNDYYIASCQQGESITEPPVPIVEGKNFDSWQLNGVSVSFPYTPSADVELVALMQTVRTEMELNTANTKCYWASYPSSADRTKVNDGTMICGHAYNSNGYYFIALAKNASDCQIKRGTNIISTSTVIYNDETYYCTYEYVGSNASDINSAFVFTSADGDFSQLAERTLDHYFYKD